MEGLSHPHVMKTTDVVTWLTLQLTSCIKVYGRGRRSAEVNCASISIPQEQWLPLEGTKNRLS